MKTVAFHTLGCKVNQYDTQAMRELFERAGYRVVESPDKADFFLINTCTVTGVGDTKSVKVIRRVHRENPLAAIIVCGCLAQRDAARVSLPGVALILGVKRRARVVELAERAVSEGVRICATDGGDEWVFERLSVSRHEGKTRAVMKIQEGCDRRCAYCVIPSVRGPSRSMPLEETEAEAGKLAAEGYKELVLTGIHLASYGRGTPHSLMDAIRSIHRVPGVERIRLGSLEPTLVTDAFAGAARGLRKLCPQFHLSLQSGSAGVLSRMRRGYTPERYREAARLLRGAYGDGVALTTDVLTGFPGETEKEARETLDFVREIRFARIHVFPYSRREGTEADGMPGQVAEAIKRERAAELVRLGNQLETEFVQSLTGTKQQVLFERTLEDGLCEGYSGQYVRVLAKAEPGALREVRIQSASGNAALGVCV